MGHSSSLKKTCLAYKKAKTQGINSFGTIKTCELTILQSLESLDTTKESRKVQLEEQEQELDFNQSLTIVTNLLETKVASNFAKRRRCKHQVFFTILQLAIKNLTSSKRSSMIIQLKSLKAILASLSSPFPNCNSVPKTHTVSKLISLDFFHPNLLQTCPTWSFFSLQKKSELPYLSRKLIKPLDHMDSQCSFSEILGCGRLWHG